MVGDSVDLVRRDDDPLERNAAAVYLASLSGSGRRTMHGKLNRAAVALGFRDAFSAPWGDLRFQHIAAVVAKLRDEDLAPATVNTILAALKGVAQAAFNLGLIDSEAHQRIRAVKALRYHRELSGRALEDEEVRRLFLACKHDPRPQGRRDFAMLALLFATGLRRQELVDLDLGDYNEETGEVLVRGKGDKERTIYVAGGAKSALDEWLVVRGRESEALFVPIHRGGKMDLHRMTPEALYNTLRRRARQAKVKRFSPHDLRRTFTTNMLTAGGDLAVVSRFVGHANVQTTARYDRRGEKAKQQLAALVETPCVDEEVLAVAP